MISCMEASDSNPPPFFCCSEVKTYDASFDSTLPSASKKRKFEENGDTEEDVKPKIPKVEADVDAPNSEKKKKKKEKRKSEEPVEQSMGLFRHIIIKYCPRVNDRSAGCGLFPI